MLLMPLQKCYTYYFYLLRFLFLPILLIFSTTTVYAETVSIVTYYGETGGIYGDGKLNVVGDKINGVPVCPGTNDNSNSVPGCDMESDSGYQRNDPNDPTDDTYSGDLIVRTSDLFELYAGWSVNGTSAAITLSSTLPADKGLAWDTLPSSCKTGSSISADGLSVTCVRSGYDRNGIGSYSEDLPFTIKVLPSTQNGVQPGSLNFTITGPTDTKTDTTETNSITITAAPKWNIQKTGYNVSENYTHNGVTGYLIRYLYYLEADEVAGEEDSTSAVLGNESLGKNFTLSFDDDVSQLSTNAELVDCKIDYSNSGDPFPFFNIANPDRSVATPLADMTQTCTQAGGKGTTIHVEHTGIDASLEHVPTRKRGGGTLPLTRSTIAIGNLEIFVPDSDVQNDGIYNAGSDSGYLDTINSISSIDPVSISGQSNFGTATESIADNSRNQRLNYFGPNYTSGNFNKYYIDNINNISPISTASGRQNGDGVLTPDREFAARVYLTNNGNKSFADSVVCDVIDTNTHTMIDISGQENQHAAKPYLETSSFDYVIEYATGYVGTWPPPIDENNEAKVITECSDAGITWHATTAAARAVGEITKVRLRLLNGDVVTADKRIGMLIRLKARGTDLNNQPLPNGTHLVNYSAVRDTVLYANRANNWRGARRKLNNYPDAPTSGFKADRAVLTRAIVRTNKTLSQSVVEPGDIVQARINSTFTTDTIDGEENNVKVIEFLDAGLKYVIGSANIGDPSFGSCADLEAGSLKDSCTADDQILIWDLGTRTANVAIEDITFDISIGATAASGIINTYTHIQSPSDNSQLSVRVANRNMTVSVPSALLISKEVNTPFRNEEQSPIEFTTFVRNGSSRTITDLDVIDVLPFNGDGTFGIDFTISTTTIKHRRSQGTSFNGSYAFLSADGGFSCASGDTWFYSNTDPRQINLSPTANSNKAGGATTWCQGTKTAPDASCGFSNAEVTAVRLSGSTLVGDASCSMNIKLTPTGNQKGDIYTNNTGAYATGVSLPVLSNNVSAFIPTTSLGDKVWIDANANGIDDDGEVGVAGIAVALLDANDVVLKTTTTDNDGFYKFIDLGADTAYKVKVTIPAFYAFAAKNQGSDINKDSDVDATGVSDIVLLNDNQQNKSIDIGLTSSLTVTGKAYKDANINSVFDNETGIEDITVNLYSDVNNDGQVDVDDLLVATTTTTADGSYTFSNVFAGNFVIALNTSANVPTTHILNGTNPLSITVVDSSITDQDYPFIAKVRRYTAQGSCDTAGFSETFGAGMGRAPLPVSVLTDYTYDNGSGISGLDNNPQLTDNEYTLVDSASIAAVGTEWIEGNDLTGDTNGRVLMVNADATAKEVYRQPVTGLTVGKSYTFRFHIANANKQQETDPQLTLSVMAGATTLSSTTTGTIAEEPTQSRFDWQQKEVVFVATQTQVDLVLTNAAASGTGNLFVVDDISLAESCKDYGDAPTSGTSYGEASHAIIAGIKLGTTAPDADTNNQASPQADGDDSNGSDDEDAVSAFPKLTDLNAGSAYELEVIATNTLPDEANLIGWIDVDANGRFDVNEASTISRVPSASENRRITLRWNSIPTDIRISDSFVRLRLTTNSITANDATGGYSDGEVEDYPLPIVIGGYDVSGRVYNDSDVDGNYDNNEKGISRLPVVLLNTSNNTCISTRTDANGNYHFFPVIPGDYRLYEASRETVPTPRNCDINQAKDPAGYRSTTANALAVFSVVDAAITGKDFADVNDPTFTPDHSDTVLPNNVIFYAHKFTPKSSGTVTFSVNSNNPSTTGWSSALYQDVNCNGSLEPAESSALISNVINTTANTAVCIVNKVYAPSNVANGEAYSNVIRANFDFNSNTVAGSIILSVTDLTKATVSNNTVTGSSKLVLRKTVQNITQNTAETATQNQAKPSDILKYRIYYRNTGTGPITDLKINDTAPAFTQLKTNSVVCETPPAGLNCIPVVNDPDVKWTFTGVLKGGDKGNVSYDVQVE